MDRRLLDYHPEIDAFMYPARSAGATRGRVGDEVGDAAELLERLDAGEAESYLAELIDRVGLPRNQAVATALASVVSNAATRLLRRPGSNHTASAARVFDVELEGLSPEEQEFELARHLVRFAYEAARQIRKAPKAASPLATARRAASSAAQSLAPGLLPALGTTGRSAGRWLRRGREVVVLDL